MAEGLGVLGGAVRFVAHNKQHLTRGGPAGDEKRAEEKKKRREGRGGRVPESFDVIVVIEESVEILLASP